MSASPTERSLKQLRKWGCQAEVVEKWISQAMVRKDLWGCVDILAMTEEDGSLGVQATTRNNISTRINKSVATPNLIRWLERKNRFEVWGWGKIKTEGKEKIKLKRIEIVLVGSLSDGDERVLDTIEKKERLYGEKGSRWEFGDDDDEQSTNGK